MSCFPKIPYKYPSIFSTFLVIEFLDRLFRSISKKNTQTSLPSPMTSDMREKAEITRDEQKPVVVNAVVEEREKYLESEYVRNKKVDQLAFE